MTPSPLAGEGRGEGDGSTYQRTRRGRITWTIVTCDGAADSRMARSKHIGRCSLCGETKPLTREHVPPRKAFNDSPVLMYKIDKTSPEARFLPDGRTQQGGHSAPTLCASCNNNTGSWYARSYVDFVKACADRADPVYANKMVAVSARFYPLRVMKQALVMLCSSCSAGLTDNNPGLRALLLDKSYRHLPHPLRLYAYVKCDQSSRASGVAGVAQVNTETLNVVAARVVAELSWWPLGLVVSFNDMVLDKATDVTHWLDCTYEQSRHETVSLPCRWAVTPYPLDYRSPAQVVETIRQNTENRLDWDRR